MMEANVSDKCYVYFDIYETPTLAEYIINDVYTGVDGDNGLYYHDGTGSYTNVDQEAGDNSYRYAGANPNNYVCFGSDATTCPEDNLYRIIGVFDGNVKLIKYDYANSDLLGTDGDYSGRQMTLGSYYKRNKSEIDSYEWGNLIEINLNINFLNFFGDEWSSKIVEMEWKTYSGIDGYNVGNVKEIFDGEGMLDDKNKIGLMYPSDYGYAASPENWTTDLRDYDNTTNTDNNWMYMGLDEYSVIRSYSCGVVNILIAANGVVGDPGYDSCSTYLSAVRPVFYLNSDVTYVSGSGTQSDPYRIA